jgi:hypothetical protein
MSICTAPWPADEKDLDRKKDLGGKNDLGEQDLAKETWTQKKAGPKRARLEVLAT